MTRTALPLALLGLTLAFLPAALAQEDNATRPDDAAWVDDCPPDMMCAAGSDDGTPSVPCPEGETCADKAAAGGNPYGAPGCIECSGPVDAPQTQSDATDEVPAPSLLAALGIVGVAALAVSLLGRR